jgi:hypothetical protein
MLKVCNERREKLGVEGTYMPHFIHDRVWVVLRECHRGAFALFRAI